MKHSAKRRGRPPTFDQKAALDVATEIFRRHGYEGTTIARLTERMGITPPTLYAAFGSKAGLYRKVFAHHREFGERPAQEPHVGSGTLYQTLERHLREAARRLTDPAGPPGCMVAIGSLQCAAENDGARETAASHRIADLEDLVRRIDVAKLAGELSEHCDARALGRFYAAVHQGMAVQAIDGAAEADLNAIAEIALTVWPPRDPN